MVRTSLKVFDLYWAKAVTGGGISKLATTVGTPAPKRAVATPRTTVITTDSEFFRVIDFEDSDRLIHIGLLSGTELSGAVITAAFDGTTFFHDATVPVACADRPRGFDSLNSNR